VLDLPARLQRRRGRRAAGLRAPGRPATASFTTTSPAAQATSPANAVDGFTISGLPVTSGSFVGTNPIWGDAGSPNAQDWLQIDLGSTQSVCQVILNWEAAYATAYALTSGHIELTPLQIGELIGGNVLSDPHQGYALAVGMALVISVTMAVYFVLERRASRWRRTS